MRLHTPREVLQEAVKAAAADRDAPPGAAQQMREVFERLRAREMLDIAMSMQSIDDLIDEIVEKIYEEQVAEERRVASFESH